MARAPSGQTPNPNKKQRLRSIAGGIESASSAPLPSADGDEPEAESKRVLQRHRLPGSGMGLPAKCPYKALGTDGDIVYILDANGQCRAMSFKDLTPAGLLSLMGRKASSYPYEVWPRLKDDSVVGWRPELAREQTITDCAAAGVWRPTDKTRGRGAWRGQAGALVLHCGDAVWIGPSRERVAGGADPVEGGKYVKPGIIDGFVYPTDAPTMRLHPEPVDADDIKQILALIATWRWDREKADPMLVLGWLAAAILGGALDWHPLMWIVGRSGSGKSTFQRMLRETLPGWLLQSTDATAASLYQTLKYDALPVALDEVESEEHNAKTDAVIKLARHAASGAVVLRGGKDHKASNFKAQSSFLFSSIYMPSMLSQDLSRLAIVQLLELDPTASPPLGDTELIATFGPMLLRRLAQQWPKLDARLEMFRALLGKAGHTQRGQSQFGTLLALADLLLNDEAPHPDNLEDSQELQAIIDTFRADRLEQTDITTRDEYAALQMLVGYKPDHYRSGEKLPLMTYIRNVADERRKHRRDVGVQPDHDEAGRVLLGCGVRVLGGYGKEPAMLAVASRHPELAKCFRETHWCAKPGGTGVWFQALGNLPSAIKPRKPSRFGGPPTKYVAVPLELVLGDSATADDVHAETALPDEARAEAPA